MLLLDGKRATIDVIKKACLKLKTPGEQILRNFTLLEPYCMALQAQNVGFKFEIIRRSDVFKQFSFLFPWTLNMLNLNLIRGAVGLDFAHMKHITVNRLPRIVLNFFYWVLFAGRSLDNKMVLLAGALCTSSTVTDIRLVHEFLMVHGINFNRSDMAITTDQGAAECIFVESYLPKMLHLTCGIHLSRVLTMHGFGAFLPLYWCARNNMDSSLETYWDTQ
jgi:hypothetical protein